uniref:Stanniocalcin n=1 Tax=Arion vulgaris TaxID=1028688 RepID=A0A0B6ZJE0_9EUPU
MIMTGLQLFLILLCVPTSFAFLFRRDTPIATAEGAVNEACLNMAEQGSCEFYTCFENRLPCGRDWYMVRTGGHYCNTMRRQRTNFSPEGQRFLNDSQQCLTRSLKELYRRDHIDCQELEDAAMSAITPCFTENAFCDIFEIDASHFIDVYEFTDLFHVGANRVWRLIVSLATRCGSEALREHSSTVGERVIDTLNSFFSYIEDSFRF